MTMVGRPVLPPTDAVDQDDLGVLADLIEDARGQATLIGPGGRQARLPSAYAN